MKKSKRKVAVLLVVAMIAGLFAGCSSLPEFDASKYLQALLDCIYKNDATQLVELKVMSEEEANTVYNSTLDLTVANTFSGMQASDEMKQRYRDIYADIFSKVNYTVKTSQKQADGSYIVTVEYKKMKLFAPTIKKIRKNLNKVSNSNVQLYLESFFTLMADSLEESLSKDLKYGNSEMIIMHIDIVDHMYKLKNEDITALTTGLIDMEAVANAKL